MCINTSIKPTSADLLKRFAENAPHQRQVAGMTVHGPSRWRHSPLAARRWELPAWLRRYLLAEVMGLLVALASITFTSRLTDNTLLLVAVSVYSGAVGYYSILFLSLFYVLRRVKPLAGSSYTPDSRRRKIRTLLMSLGSAELVDSLLLSPLLLYLALHLLPNQQLAVVVSEAGLVVVLLVALTVITIGSQVRLNRRYEIAVPPPPIPTDAASIARGQHLATAVTGCTKCHGADLSGHLFADAPPFLLVSSNLTRGAGGVGGQYSDADWVRAIRYGVRPNGKSLIFMPSQHFNKLSNEDLAALIAYIKSVAPVDHEQEPSTLRLLGRLLLLIGEYPLPAEIADAAAPIPVAPPAGRTVEYGNYLVGIGACSECHGAKLAGAAAVEPGAPPGRNLTPGGNIGQWSETEFINTLRTGLRPDGTAINAAMPWWVLAQQTDDELGAIYAYLRSLPALPTAGN